MRVLELFSGIGAVSALLEGHADVVGAVDQNGAANQTYRLNTGRVPEVWNLASVKASQLAKFEADLWWMSPPCQPFTVRGAQRDMDDPRCAALLRVLALISEIRPRRLALENVPGFVDSAMRRHLLEVLRSSGYHCEESILCPTELGVPMVRKRYYLVACRACELFAPAPPLAAPAPLAAYLTVTPAEALFLDAKGVRGFGHSALVLDPTRPTAVASCFTAAYGRSPVHAGAYLADQGRIRRFSPEEVLGLLGFPARWAFPPEMTVQRRWELAGNSLSVDAVRQVLQRHLPNLSVPGPKRRDNLRVLD